MNIPNQARIRTGHLIRDVLKPKEGGIINSTLRNRMTILRRNMEAGCQL